MDSLRKNIGVIFKAELDSETIEPVVSIFSKTSLTKEGTFCRIQQDELRFGMLPAESCRTIQNVKKSPYSLNKVTEVNGNNNVIWDIFMKTRDLFLVQLSMEIYVIEELDVCIILTNQISRMTGNGDIKVLQLNTSTVGLVFNQFSKQCESIASVKNGDFTNSMMVNTMTRALKSPHCGPNKNMTVYRTERFELSRNEHTPTVVDPEPSSRKMTKCMAYPLHRTKYNNPEMASYDDDELDQTRSPVQVTETDIGELSLGVSPPARNYAYWNSSDMASSARFYGTSASSRRQGGDLSYSLVPSGTSFRTPEEPPKYPDFATYNARLGTFFNGQWSPHKPQPTDLAELGLFLKDGQGDLTRCFQCGIGFKDWSESDDPLRERVKHSPNCPFLQKHIGKNRIEALKRSLNNNGATGDVTQGPHDMKSPRYQTMQARIASFRDFPETVNITPQQFAIAGLFYTGTDDLCRCFTCDGGLKTWEAGDDPIQEHALYFPKCPYIIQLKGQNYIRRIQAAKTRNQTTGGTSDVGLHNGATAGAHNTHATNDVGTGSAGTRGSQVPGTIGGLDVTEPNMSLTSNTDQFSEHKINQVSQRLGFSETEIIQAMVALEVKGNRQPTMSDVMNMLLDIKEQEAREREQKEQERISGPSVTTMSRENATLSQQVYCMLCVIEESNVLFLPCACHRVCTNCAKDLTHCPVCNSRVEEKVRTYRA